MDFEINVQIVLEEVGHIFKKDGKNKLKISIKNKNVYSNEESLTNDIEIVANKSEFDKLLENENKFFKKPQIFNLDELNGEIVLTEFDSIYSRTNAATLKTLLGLKEGVYQYEVQLGSNGSMHIGWATENCVFNDTILVGQTVNSYGFDGNKSKKWNESIELHYGQKWRVGNIIGCKIDFTKNIIEYFNNGQSLGIAFEKFIEDDTTYFPAVSLSKNENITVNLGTRPFKFPILGANPIFNKPTNIIQCFKPLGQNVISLIENQISLQTNTKKNEKNSNKLIVHNIIMKVLLNQFISLLKAPYIIDYCLVTFFNDLSKKSPKKLKTLLEMMWENIPEHEMLFIFDHFMFCMLCDFKCTWRSKFDTSYQEMVLKLLNELCKETNTRKQMIANVLFDKVKLAHFLHIIAPSDELFSNFIPLVYWSVEHIELNEEMKTKLVKQFPQKYKSHKSSYENACKKLKHSLNELEKLQLIFLRTLLNDTDQTDKNVSSRIIFSRRLQGFIQENMIYWQNDPMFKLPGPVLLSTFFRLSFLMRDLWKEELGEEKTVRVHPNVFYIDNYNYFGLERFGGTFLYLKSRYQEDVKLKLGFSYDYSNHDSNEGEADEEEEIIEIHSIAGLIAVLTQAIANAGGRSGSSQNAARTILKKTLSFDHLPTEKRHVLSVLLNNVICLFFVAARKQLIEYTSFKDRLRDLSINYALLYYEWKNSDENVEHLQVSCEKIRKKIELASRHMAWLMSMVFVDEKEQILSWVLLTIINTIKYCSHAENELFRFVPETYLDSLSDLNSILNEYTKIYPQFGNLTLDVKWLAILVCEVLFHTVEDKRIIQPKLKELITQGIILYLTGPKSIGIIEDVSEQLRRRAMLSILKPSNRLIWSNINMVFMLIWYGSGFGFRHTRLPHLENRFISIQGPMEDILFIDMGVVRSPAYVLQNDLRTVIAINKTTAMNFINRSLNHLNWAFSEFTSLFQEVRKIIESNNQPTTLHVNEMNNLKSCGKNYILTVTLLRIIEMMITFDRDLVTGQEGSVGRVFQLLCQILNRINSSTSTFTQIMSNNFPHVEHIHKFPILVATTGVLLSLLETEINEKILEDNNSNSKISSIPDITDILISDPNFMLSSMDFLILPENENSEPFSLKSYKKYFTTDELKKVEVMYQHIEWYVNRRKSIASSINEDDLCLLCYSNKKNVTLLPCKHRCCKSCINHHILYSSVCFYCKGWIESVVDINDSSIVIHNFGNQPLS